MTSHEVISGAAGGSIASGVSGLLFSYVQIPDATFISNAVSIAGIIIGGGAFIWQRINKSRRQDHNNAIESEGQEITLLSSRVREILMENIELSRQIVDLNKQLVEQAAKQVCDDTCRRIECKDAPDAKEATG